MFYEYFVRVISPNLNGQKRQEIINSLSDDGWKLVCVDDHVFYFERLKNDNDKPVIVWNDIYQTIPEVGKV